MNRAKNKPNLRAGVCLVAGSLLVTNEMKIMLSIPNTISMIDNVIKEIQASGLAKREIKSIFAAKIFIYTKLDLCIINMRYKKHVFVCTNQKLNGKACCGEERGTEILLKMKEIAREKGIQGEIRIQRAGCLDACSQGPAMVIYPEGTYYGNLSLDDLKEIVEKHLIGNETIESLELKY